MLITISGVHGLGKTTLVNELDLKMPVVKIVDSDILMDNTITDPVENQMKRILIYKTILSTVSVMPRNIPVIIDSSPLDFYVYLEATAEKSHPRYDFCMQQINATVKLWKSLKPTNVLLVPLRKEDVFKNICKRNRSCVEYEMDIFDLVYDMFYINNSEFFAKLVKHISTTTRIDLGKRAIERIVNKNS